MWVIYNPKVHTLIDSNKVSFHTKDGKYIVTLDIVFKDCHLQLFKVKIDNPLPAQSKQLRTGTHTIPPKVTPVGVKETVSTQTQTAVISQNLNNAGSGGTTIYFSHSCVDVQSLDITHINALDSYISKVDKVKK